jgi:hypothetical protein
MLSLAELAWLGVFAVLILTQSREQEVAKLKSKFSQYSNYAKYEQQIDKLLTNFTGTNTSNFGDYVDSVIQSRNLLPEKEAKLIIAEQKLQSITETLRILETDLEDKKIKIDALEGELTESESQQNDYTRSIVKANSIISDLETKKNNLLKERKDKIQQEVLIRKELLGLPNKDLGKVVFVIDNSSSIRNSEAWNNTKQLINIWLEYLRVEQVAIILYSDEVVKFPNDGFATVIDDGGRKDSSIQQKILSFFNGSLSGVYSDMAAGLSNAYALGSSDIIILISDGKPKTKSKSTKVSERKVMELINKNSYTPILTIAVSDYYVLSARSPREEPNPAISFLKQVSSASGGNFIGK